MSANRLKKRKLLKINNRDNVAVSLEALYAGERHILDGEAFVCLDNIPLGHKIALADIKKGSEVIKYGFPIGCALADIKAGSFVHTHNLVSNLEGSLQYTFIPSQGSVTTAYPEAFFSGYARKDGSAGIRNEIWIVPTVSCVNHTAKLVAAAAAEKYRYLHNIDGVHALTHPYGCSQLGDDHRTTQKILGDIVRHPNAGAVLVMGLGCENNHVEEFKRILGDIPEGRVRFIVTQEARDELEESIELIDKLALYAAQFKRQQLPVSMLRVGLKCGASDGFSGITANPLVGRFSDRITGMGGTAVLTEVPEMFGAETILLQRAQNEAVFNRIAGLVNRFKEYYINHGQPIDKNPSPGNLEGGITTLEEKSLGCIQKSGTGKVVDVLGYGERVVKNGLNILEGPGNDPISTTALAAAGCQMLLFTTGRGNPLGSFVPTVKISSNPGLSKHKASWIDFDAAQILEGENMDIMAQRLMELVLKTASGEYRTKSELAGFKELGIFKSGVIL